jgi:cyclohexyl-isocyanide hydratase
MPRQTTIVALLFPEVTQLDLTGPAQVFANLPDTEVALTWQTTAPVRTDCGWSIVPTHSFDACPDADVLFVPGGGGTFDLLEDPVILGFLRRQAATARWITSVCTGSFLLAAAGLLTGRRATSHWASLDMLAEFGVTPVHDRVVIDGNLVTGAGVTSGIDFALTLAATEHGDAVARSIQLTLEYDPAPPYPDGSARLADPQTVARGRAHARETRLARVRAAAARQHAERAPSSTGPSPSSPS